MNGRTIFGLAVVLCTLAFPLRLDAQRPEIADTENKAALKIKSRSWGTSIEAIECIALSPDNKKLLIAPCPTFSGIRLSKGATIDVGEKRIPSSDRPKSSDLKLTLWDLAQEKETLTLTGHKILVTAVAFSRDGKKAVAAGGDSIYAGAAPKSDVIVWDLKTGALTKRFEVEGSVTKLAPTGTFLLTVSRVSGEASRVMIYDIDNDCKKVFSADFKGRQFPWTVSPDGGTLATINPESGILQVWNVATGKESMRFDLSGDDRLQLAGYPFLSLSFSRDGKTLCGQGVGTFCWSIPEKKWLYHNYAIRRGFALSGEGHYLLSNAGNDFGDFTLISLKSGERVADLGRVPREAFALAADATVAVAVVGGSEARIHVWDLPKNLPE